MSDWRERAKLAGIDFWLKHNATTATVRDEARRARMGTTLAGLEADFGTTDIQACPLIDPVYDETAWGELSSAHVVYAIWPVGEVFVKLGHTTDLAGRLKGLQTGSPRPLLTVVRFRSGMKGWDEERLHARFATQRTIGEWFLRDGAFEAWIGPAIDRAVKRTAG